MLKFAFIFLIIALVIAGVGFWYWQENVYSKDVLKLEILGPDKVTMGEEVEYLLKYKNNGTVRLENPLLVFEYPSGALPSGGNESRITRSLEEIYPGQEETLHFPARL